MKLLRINHLGIASPTLDEAMARMGKLFGMEVEHVEEVASQKVKTAFFPVGPSTLEYLEPTQPDSPVAKFMEKKGPGIHHVAFEVDDVDAAVKELLGKGIRMIDKEPRPGAHGSRIAFIHPAETGGMLIELCTTPTHA
ncbi:MAG: methylmalonyl-CoA epimerase [Holophaga sp.]|nr:methylmalonyl-CoA epimerase [Holophaga sp.]